MSLEGLVPHEICRRVVWYLETNIMERFPAFILRVERSCTLKMEAAYSFEVLVHFYQTTRQLNLDDSVKCTGCWVCCMWPFKITKRINVL
jgi:hypothetical protein